MNVPLIEEETNAAEAKLRAYRGALQRGANQEYFAAARAYKELAKGKALIDLTAAFELAPLDAKTRPMLAIARATKREVCLRVRNNSFEFTTSRNQRGGLEDFVAVPHERSKVDGYAQGYSMVPLVPPECLPKASLASFHILWEVEAWADRPQLMRPDRDPLLLRHIAGHLYAVEASWDLTEVERLVMSGRRPVR